MRVLSNGNSFAAAAERPYDSEPWLIRVLGPVPPQR